MGKAIVRIRQPDSHQWRENKSPVRIKWKADKQEANAVDHDSATNVPRYLGRPPRPDDCHHHECESRSWQLHDQAVGSPELKQEGKTTSVKPAIWLNGVARVDVLEDVRRVNREQHAIYRCARAPRCHFPPTLFPNRDERRNDAVRSGKLSHEQSRHPPQNSLDPFLVGISEC